MIQGCGISVSGFTGIRVESADGKLGYSQPSQPELRTDPNAEGVNRAGAGSHVVCRVMIQRCGLRVSGFTGSRVERVLPLPSEEGT